MATALKWPGEIWPLLLQCKLHCKGLEVISALSVEDILNYDKIKATVQRSYELVPEAYRQKFREHRKNPSQTDFAREKGNLFDRWCAACEIDDFAALRELTLLEKFKKSLPERMLVHLNVQKVMSLFAAAVMADEYMLMHKTVFSTLMSADRHRTAPVKTSALSKVQSESRRAQLFLLSQTWVCYFQLPSTKKKGTESSDINSIRCTGQRHWFNKVSSC